MNPLKPYLVRSGAVHLFGAALLILIPIIKGPPVKKNFYTIDFMGGAAGGGVESQNKGKAMPDAPKQKVQPDALPSTKRWLNKAKAATLKYSEMAVKAKPEDKDTLKAQKELPVMGASRKELEGKAVSKVGGGGAEVTADLADFPFPWYLARLRSALWSTWSHRMDGGNRTAMVSFVIDRSGNVSDVSISDSSGDGDFDYAAMGAVQEASPLPPLPADYHDNDLKVHVKFQSL